MEDVYKTTDKKNRFDESGLEILNPTPMQPPLGYERKLSLAEQIRSQIRAFKHLDDQEPETEEEADDFEIEDDPAIHSRWENDNIPSIKNMRERKLALQRELASYQQDPPANAPGADPSPEGGSA